MVDSSHRVLSSLLGVFLLSNCMTVYGQQKNAYDLLPASTQAVVMIPDGERLLANWDRTELARLAADPAVAPFFDEQRQEIEKRFVDAGWRLNVKPDDISGFLTGQIAVAWMAVDNLRKPFAMSMVADIENDPKSADQMLAQIDKALVERKASKTRLDHLGVKITKYTLPARAGELLAQHTFYAAFEGTFLATDDAALINSLIASVKGTPDADAKLNQDADFLDCQEKIAVGKSNDLEYFARPLGFAKILRSIGGRRAKDGPDMLAILENQGFGAIRSVSGGFTLGGEELDIVHQGFVLADNPLPLSAAVLDFPNKAAREIPRFIGNKISTLLVANWNSNEAFWKIEGLVDEIAGTPGVFNEVVEGLKLDPHGPQVDLREEVLPRFTNDIYAISDSPEGEATINSRRNLIALRLNDAAGMTDVINRAMQNEPDAVQVEFEGHEIWEVHQSEGTGDFGDFDDFDDEPTAPAGGQPEPLLNDWAITVFDEYVMFASHVEMIEEAIVQSQKGPISSLIHEVDFQRATQAITQRFGKEEACAWNVVRTDRAYRVQYELFRAGKLNESQSMLASVLDKLLQNESEIRGKEQRVKGRALPPFEKVAAFLQPSAMLVRSVDQGWEFGSVMLAAPADQKPTKGLSHRRDIDTARVTNVLAGENR